LPVPIRIEQQEDLHVPGQGRTPIVPLVRLLQTQHPELADPDVAIAEQRVLVDGRVVDNPRARVPRTSSIRVIAPHRLRGATKLASGLDALAAAVGPVVAVDVGAAAGGFTTTLLARGAIRVYAVDAGFGQLSGSLRIDPRVVGLERTNLAALDDALVPEPVELVTMDLSYLAVATAVPSLGQLRLAPGARLLALVKPTFELRAATVVTEALEVRASIRLAARGIDAAGWTPIACTLPSPMGAGGAIESFVLATWRGTEVP
jgi:23S rRNA (cytidine1920-2'-O)/16S rRNA (cytidine1409-2'-O)-methyltransferase